MFDRMISVLNESLNLGNITTNQSYVFYSENCDRYVFEAFKEAGRLGWYTGGQLLYGWIAALLIGIAIGMYIIVYYKKNKNK